MFLAILRLLFEEILIGTPPELFLKASSSFEKIGMGTTTFAAYTRDEDSHLLQGGILGDAARLHGGDGVCRAGRAAGRAPMRLILGPSRVPRRASGTAGTLRFRHPIASGASRESISALRPKIRAFGALPESPENETK